MLGGDGVSRKKKGLQMQPFVIAMAQQLIRRHCPCVVAPWAA